MKIYWMFLCLSLVMCFVCNNKYRLVKCGNHYEARAYILQGFLFFGVIAFFCGLRSGIGDTGAYIGTFQQLPASLSEFDWDSKDAGFYALAVLYKQFISDDYHGWLFLITLITCLFLVHGYIKYSAWFGFSCYLFIATVLFTYLVSGMRQFICVAILFACTDLIIKRKFILYAIIIIVLSQIHSSTLLLIPMYFVVNTKAWGNKTWLLICGAFVVGVGFDRVVPLFGALLEETQYSDYTSIISSGGVGVNAIRVALAGIPVLLSYIGRETIEEEGYPLINVCINMSILNFCIYFVGLFSSGMAFGRLSVYFDIYNTILIPWLLLKIFNRKSTLIVIILCIAGYLGFFYYQMAIVWNLPYESDILNLYL